tara:strand:- start:72984 stop:73529 length:546 start_codon:yes stop_codon:yes gene_type:complete
MSDENGKLDLRRKIGEVDSIITEIGSDKRGRIVNNIIDSDGDIKVIMTGESNSRYIKAYDVILAENENREVATSCDDGYKFKTSSPEALDFDSIEKELSAKKPMALINANDKRYVALHRSLMHKANVVGIKMPKTGKQLSANTVRVKQQFSVWVAWAREVRAASWGSKQETTHVKIVLPNV